MHGLREAWIDGTEGVAALPRNHDLRFQKMARLGARRRRKPALYPARAGTGDQLLRYRRHVLQGRQRGGPRPGAAGFRPVARSRCRRHQGLQPDGRRSQPARPFPQAHPPRHRRQPETPRHGLRGPLSDPPLRLRYAHRGNAGSARPRGQERESPVYRGVLHVRLAVRQDCSTRPTPWAFRVSPRCRTTTT